jgi:hypothetical protein
LTGRHRRGAGIALPTGCPGSRCAVGRGASGTGSDDRPIRRWVEVRTKDATESHDLMNKR